MTRGVPFQAGDPQTIAWAKQGAAQSTITRQSQRAQRWKQAGIDPVIAEQIYQQGYNAGWAKGKGER